MLQNELKAMLNEEECIGVPADEEYQEYLIDYILDENLFENELSDYCVFPIGYNQSIIYIKSDNPLTGGDRRFRIQQKIFQAVFEVNPRFTIKDVVSYLDGHACLYATMDEIIKSNQK